MCSNYNKDKKCDCDQNFQTCNCVNLQPVRYIDEKGNPQITAHEYKSLPDFRRYCELYGIDHTKYGHIVLGDYTDEELMEIHQDEIEEYMEDHYCSREMAWEDIKSELM